MREFIDEATRLDNPIRVLGDFLKADDDLIAGKFYEKSRFVGYVLDIGFRDVRIITCDPFKVAVGGVPRNSFLIMTPALSEELPSHFTLLRVLASAPTPLSQDVQKTYFELQKKSMPEIDVFTQSELQWGALATEVIGMFYPHPENDMKVEFSGDLNNFVSAHKYRVYAPDDKLLDFIANTLVPSDQKFLIGKLRMTESRLPLPGKSLPDVAVYASAHDFFGTRTALFGKTRLGKSNTLKVIAENLIIASHGLAGTTGQNTASKGAKIPSTTEPARKAGQLIFDINGEYANDNPQDNSFSLRSAYKELCDIFAINPRSNDVKPLRLNFYEQPDKSIGVLRDFLEQDRKMSDYIRAFANAVVPSVEEVRDADRSKKLRLKRKLLFFWAILSKAGFTAKEDSLRKYAGNSIFDPEFATKLREKVYAGAATPVPNDLNSLKEEISKVIEYLRANPSDDKSSSGSGPLFEDEDWHLLNFFNPRPGLSGTSILVPYRNFHSPDAGNYVDEIMKALDNSRTVILDLGNANPKLVEYFSEELSGAVFSHQMEKFTSNALGNHYIQIYFEEAHNLFPRKDEEILSIYSRLAKEGAKYHIGMVYATQSPSTIYKDLLAQTENFFVAHISSADEVGALARLNSAFESFRDDILVSKTPGFIRMLTQSSRFVMPVQVRKFEPIQK